ncbi:ankyrin repeat-containing protein NPR4-like isoform X2 [Corylus avellana]|uniref:ankyrin repeat-containing protein NPR4-like isoform X2 n=1 Tax=Corylus avellana TaxID=13451 RepID=UPI00286B103A|nr:ankyrin repeat-containing protein NPR4-like isoform X2 [Corylus avellana]
MEGAAVNIPHKRRHKAKVTIQKVTIKMTKVTIFARKKTFPRTSYPQRPSSEPAIDQQRSSSAPSIPSSSYQHVEVPQETSVDARTSQEESVKIDVVEEESTSQHNANEFQTDDREQRYQSIRDSLYPAAAKGDWQSANDLNKKYSDIWEIPITVQQMNALQVAVTTKQTAFVKELLNCMTAEQLEFINNNGDTALAITALSGNVEIAKKMVKMNNKLPMIRNKQELLPLLIAAMHREKDMVLYLYGVTKFEELTFDERIKLLLQVIFCDLYDIALEMLKKDSSLTIAEDKSGGTALEQLARKPIAIGSRSHMSVWERCIGYCFKGVYQKALMRAYSHQLVEAIWTDVRKLPSEQFIKYATTIFCAAKLGNVEFLTILIRNNHDLIWMLDENKQNIFHISILYRQESIFNLIHEIGIFKNMVANICDKYGNNMLHLTGILVGELAHVERLKILSGATLHMQRELLWYKEIEKIVPLKLLNAKNCNGETPQDLFTKRYENLQHAGEMWMRSTANHCMLVATLIATVVFAATFTVPGGNEEGKGTPIFLEHNWFLVFFISNSIALLSSSTSIIIFLSILTSRYTEMDFLSTLPRRLMLGLLALFISIVGMVVAFGATCFLVYQHKMTKISFRVP